MESKIIAKQILDFQKTLLKNVYTTNDTMQKKSEKLAQIFIDPQSEQTKSLVNTWLSNMKQGQDKLKKLQDENMERLERYLLGTP